MERIVRSETLAGKTLGRYRVEQLLVRGTESAIYRALDQHLGRPVAIKAYLTGAQGAHPLSENQVLSEARLVATLDHPNLLPIYDYGKQEGIFYLVMHLASGGSLADQVSRGTPLSLTEIAHYLDQAAAALDYVHTRGIIHCNLKPSNLLLRERWLMLGGFGKARRLNQNGPTTIGHLAGNPHYLAPELRANGSASPPTDIYALGATLYFLLWSQRPNTDLAGRWDGNLRLAGQLPPALAGREARLAQELEALLKKALAFAPKDRYQSAGEMAAEFRAMIASPAGTPGVTDTRHDHTGQQPLEVPIICPKCGFLNKPQAKFCRNDGVRLPAVCPICGTENRPDAKFCQNDGTELVRICPTCRAINPRQARFCYKDHTALVRLCPICGTENSLRAIFCQHDGAQLFPDTRQTTS